MVRDELAQKEFFLLLKDVSWRSNGRTSQTAAIPGKAILTVTQAKPLQLRVKPT